MPTTSAQMGLSIPTLNGDPGSWDSSLNSSLALIDVHDHTAGKGPRIPTAGISLNADLTFAGYAATNLKAAAFTAQASYTTNKALWVNSANDDLYYRRAGTDNRLTVGGVLNVALVGGIAGDYSAAAASLYYDDAAEAYRFLEAAPSPNDWSYVKAGGFDLYEHASGISNYVALRSPAALAATYTLTFPAAVPVSKSLVQVSSAGVLTFENTGIGASTFSGLITASAGVTAAANQHITISGTGDYKHGDKVMVFAAGAVNIVTGTASWAASAANFSTTAAGSIVINIPLKTGDQIKSVTFRISGDGAVDASSDVSVYTAAGAATSIGSGTHTNVGASADVTVNVTDTTLASGEQVQFFLSWNAANFIFYNLRVTYDRP